MKQPQFGLDDVRDYVNNLSGLFKGKPTLGRAGNQNIQDAIVKPGRLLGEVSGVADAYRAVKPGSSAKDKALGLLSVAGPLSAQEAAVAGGLAAAKAARAVKGSKTVQRLKTGPYVSFDDYILHGGPTPDNLVGGVIDPDYVRGGALQQSANKMYQPSVASGPNQVERNYLLKKEMDAVSSISNNPGTNNPFKNPKEAEEWLNRHSDILNRVKAGEEHSTGVSPYLPEQAYYQEGGTYLLKVPPELRTTDTPAPTGEVKFWGKQQPRRFVPLDRNAQYQAERSGDYLGFNRSYVNDVTQALIDDADMTAGQRLANAIARSRGVKITPAYRQYLEDMFTRRFDREMVPYVRNPKFGTEPREILEYFSDFGNAKVPLVQNYDDVVAGIRSAKTQEELMRAIRSTIPNEQLDIYFKQSLNPTSFQNEIDQILSSAKNLRGDYRRLKNIG